MSKELIDICRVRVKFSETDAMQRVWHGSYVTYFEDGRESFGRHYPGIGYADIQRSGIYAPVYDLQLFIDPAGQLLLDLPDYYVRWKERFVGGD